MLASRKTIKVMNLGDIITPDFAKLIAAFTNIIASKNPNTDIKKIQMAILTVIKSTTNTVDKFKLGAITEDEFNALMIDELAQATGVTLSPEEFNAAWNAMHPDYPQFEAPLKVLSEYNDQPDQQVILVSFTNTKDMRHIAASLKAAGIPYQLENDELAEIDGIKLVTSYTRKQTKAQLIEAIIKNAKRSSRSASPLSSSMSDTLGTEKLPSADVLYIRGVNHVNDPVLSAELDKTNADVDKTTQMFLVDTLIWMKTEKQLTEILRAAEPSVRKIASIIL